MSVENLSQALKTCRSKLLFELWVILNSVFFRYFDCFSALSDKIQIRDGDCPIPFRWKSAFTEKSLFTGKRDLTLNYAGYEKACVLFNIAAYQSKYAGSLELGSDEDLRVAVRYFQSSANIFDLLKNDIMAFVSDEANIYYAFKKLIL